MGVLVVKVLSISLSLTAGISSCRDDEPLDRNISDFDRRHDIWSDVYMAVRDAVLVVNDADYIPFLYADRCDLCLFRSSSLPFSTTL